MTTDSEPNLHLSQTQLSEWALGERNASVSEHVASCGRCRAQTEEFDKVLDGFRDSARQWGARRLPAKTADFRNPRRKPFYQRPALWAGTAAAAFVMALALMPTAPHNFQTAARTHPAAPLSKQEETALLTQIDQEVSRTVPAAMEPLSSLVAGDGAHSGNAVR